MDTEIVEAMIDLTHTLGIKVIAEGVENAEHLAQSRQIKYDLAQGDYFSQPLAGNALGAILEELSSNRG